MLITKIVNRNSVHGYVLGTVVLAVIIWQIFGSVGLTTRNFWKFYLANVIGLILFLIIFMYKSLWGCRYSIGLSINKEGFAYVLIIPMIGLFVGLIRNNVNFKPIDDSQRVNQHEQSNPTEKEWLFGVLELGVRLESLVINFLLCDLISLTIANHFAKGLHVRFNRQIHYTSRLCEFSQGFLLIIANRFLGILCHKLNLAERSIKFHLKKADKLLQQYEKREAKDLL